MRHQDAVTPPTGAEKSNSVTARVRCSRKSPTPFAQVHRAKPRRTPGSRCYGRNDDHKGTTFGVDSMETATNESGVMTIANVPYVSRDTASGDCGRADGTAASRERVYSCVGCPVTRAVSPCSTTSPLSKTAVR